MKIIGSILFVLLFIIGIVILVAALVLFAPVRYRISAVFENDGKSVIAKIRWLLGLVSVTIKYTGETDTIIRIFGIRPDKAKAVFSKLKRKKKKVKNNQSKAEAEIIKPDGNKPVNAERDTVINDKDTSEHKTKKSKKDKDKKNKRSRRFGGKIKNIFKKISDLHISSYWDILRAPDNKAPFSILKGTLWKIVKHSSPKKVQADLIIGTGDPCNTGLLFGFFGIMISFVPGKYNLTPDFYEKCLKGKLYIKGRIRMVVLLYHAIKIITDKELKRIKKDIDKVRA